MFSFYVKFREDLNEIQSLPDTRIDGVCLDSSLGIALSCLQGNLVELLDICKNITITDLPFIPFKPFSSGVRREIAQTVRRKIFSTRAVDFLGEDVKPLGNEDDLSTTEFQYLCDFIKKNTHLRVLRLHPIKSFTIEEEDMLIAAIQVNSSIEHVVLLCGSNEMKTALEALDGRRLRVTAFNVIARRFFHSSVEETIEENNAKKNSSGMSMHLLQGFIAVLGIGTVASALVCLSILSLNPTGLIVATTGTAALAWSTYSFFTSASRPDFLEQSVVAPFLNLNQLM